MRRQKALPLVTLMVVSSCFTCLNGAFTSSSLRHYQSGHPSVGIHNNGLNDASRRHLKPHQQQGSRRLSISLNSILSSAEVFANTSNSPWMPLYLSCIAGASTCLGAAIVFWHPQRKSIGPNTMAFSLSLAASVMITVSVLSLGPECLRDVSTSSELLQRVTSFGLGCLLYRMLSYLAFPEPDELVLELQGDNSNTFTGDDIHTQDSSFQSGQESAAVSVMDSSLYHNGSEHKHSSSPSKHRQELSMRSRKSSQLSRNFDSSDSLDEETGDLEKQEKQALLVAGKNDDYAKSPPTEPSSPHLSLSQWSSGADLDAQQRRAWRVAMLLFVSLLIHNFPEGLAVAASSLQSTKLGLAVTFGIMVHNIPEGIAIAVPCLAARPDRPWLAFLLASASGLAEPLGAAFALLVLRNSHEALPMENVLAFVAGIMITVALWELFPEARRHKANGWYFAGGTISGILIMAATELYLP